MQLRLGAQPNRQRDRARHCTPYTEAHGATRSHGRDQGTISDRRCWLTCRWHTARAASSQAYDSRPAWHLWFSTDASTRLLRCTRAASLRSQNTPPSVLWSGARLSTGTRVARLTVAESHVLEASCYERCAWLILVCVRPRLGPPERFGGAADGSVEHGARVLRLVGCHARDADATGAIPFRGGADRQRRLRTAFRRWTRRTRRARLADLDGDGA